MTWTAWNKIPARVLIDLFGERGDSYHPRDIVNPSALADKHGLPPSLLPVTEIVASNAPTGTVLFDNDGKCVAAMHGVVIGDLIDTVAKALGVAMPSDAPRGYSGSRLELAAAIVRHAAAAGPVPAMTTVWNRSKGSPPFPADAVHVGRQDRFRGLKASPFKNPWSMIDPNDQERAAVVAKFGRWLFGDADLIAEKGRPPSLEEVRTLAGKALVCWCVPKLCHGHILAAVADGLIVDRDGLEQWIAGHRAP